MNVIWTLAAKDLLLLWRDRASMFWMFGLPLIFAAFFGTVFGGSGPDESNPLQVAIVEEGLSAAGRRIIDRIASSDAIEVQLMPRAKAADAVRLGRKLAWLEIVHAPEEDLGMFAGEAPSIRIGIDPSRGAERGLLQGLVSEAMFKGFAELMTNPSATRAQLGRMLDKVKASEDMPTLQKLALTTFFGAFAEFLDTPQLAGGAGGTLQPEVEIVDVTRQRRGPPNAYSISFPQSILWGILGCAAGFAMTLVRERTNGTMVRLLTAPLRRGHLIAGKALACALSCCAVVIAMTTIGALAFGVSVGSVPMLALATVAAASCFAGITLLLGSLARTEQAVSGLAWGILLVCAMLGGGMVPQIVMPRWMLEAGAISPARWTITALEGAIWRDFSSAEMALPCGVLFAFGAAAMWLGSIRLRRGD
ncbi:MAG: ABC transporter permease [Planctomycetes bacterium]|nr:ABC transporter permease [Planctomycetota bacterium]